MATIKSYTDYSQAQILSKILPDKSADMCYIQDLLDGGRHGEYKPYIGDLIPAYGQDKIKCWSLAALLSALPHIQEFYPTLEKINDKYVCRYKGSGIWTNGNNPIDACCEMILKLHELKML